MTRKEFLAELEEVLEADSGSIIGNEVLSDLEGWDSLAVMAFIAMVDEKFDTNLAPSKIADSKTVGDLIDLLGDKITE
ncbi:MAG: acyl carrier protein [Desulfoprunum sp.]